MQKIRVLILVCMMVLCAIASVRAEETVKRVLLLNSYHPGFPTSPRIIDGIRSVFDPEKIRLHVEFMDSKRLLDPVHLENIRRLLAHKLSKRPPYDLLITSDDNAFNFALAHRETIFRGLPLVFCGVNNVNSALSANASPQVTGVAEAISMKETLKIILRLHPETSGIIAVVDETPSGQGDLRTFYTTGRHFPGLRFSELSLTELSFPALADRLRALRPDTAVLLLSAYRDRDGTSLSFDESLKRIVSDCPVPVYHLWEHGMGQGVAGGKIISQYEQGRTAATLALEILRGRNIAEIPVIVQSPNRYMFDYRMLRRFGADLSKLPKDAVVINRPVSFYQKNRGLIRSIVSVFFALTLIIFFLIFNMVKRNRAEKALRESEQNFRSLSENSHDRIIRYDRQYRCIYVNQAAIDLMGLPPDQIMMKTHRETGVAEALCDLWEKRIQEVFETGEARQEIFEFKGPRRSLLTLDWRVFPEFSDTDGVITVLGVSRDITALKQAENALRESEAKYRNIYENIQDVYFETTPEGTIAEISPSVENVLGYGRDELTGRSVQELYAVPAEWDRAVQHLMNDGKISNHEITLSDKDGTPHPCWVNAIIIRDSAGDPVRFSGSARDIRRQKQAEAEKKKLEARLRQAQKLEALGTLAGGIAHDFNNILFPIMGYTEMLLDDLPAEGQNAEYLREILNASNRARDLVRQILTFSRKDDIEFRPFRVQPIIRESLKLLRATIPSTIEFRQHIDESCGPVMGDPTQIHQILMNLCTNAWHAIPDQDGCIEVSLKPAGRVGERGHLPPEEYLCLTVSDTGHGIEREALERIFDPYFTTKEIGKGTGLGLSVVHGIVREHGGDIEVHSEPGGGTVFRICLPVLSTPPDRPSGSALSGDLPGGREHILLVDDEKQILLMEKQMLERLGYRVSACGSGPEALEAFRKDPAHYDLVVSDVTMPGMSGDGLAREMIGIRPDIPVILCTGFSEKISREKVDTLGVRGFLIKPVNRKDLAETIRSVLAGG
ncbi:hypothetical protein DENIS_2933 [Desulfonema ishimotonii]|uniref:histidine kinase n=1 Tax=Desulfonema ishimotonii TaxID=45657 RepID=A0A401FYD6_9BACT|nr:PAS domain S-box protein [Desulfonema ishimotonii]GBC61970.1 hypothetical protein DENIS_2933 [Desulfonema ishimotonii]